MQNWCQLRFSGKVFLLQRVLHLCQLSGRKMVGLFRSRSGKNTILKVSISFSSGSEWIQMHEKYKVLLYNRYLPYWQMFTLLSLWVSALAISFSDSLASERFEGFVFWFLVFFFCSFTKSLCDEIPLFVVVF